MTSFNILISDKTLEGTRANTHSICLTYCIHNFTFGNDRFLLEPQLVIISSSLLLISSIRRKDLLLDLGLPLKTSILYGLPSISRVRFSFNFLLYSFCPRNPNKSLYNHLKTQTCSNSTQIQRIRTQQKPVFSFQLAHEPTNKNHKSAFLNILNHVLEKPKKAIEKQYQQS